MRADLRASLTAAATVLALTATAAPAFAEDPTVGIGRAVTGQYDRGTFQVTAWTDAPDSTITAVSAVIRKGDKTIVELPSLTERSWAKGVFDLPQDARLKLTEDGGPVPELGRYAIDVTATDSKGNTLTRKDAGVLDFTLKPVLSLDLGVPSWNDRNVRPTGTLKGVQPGSGDEVVIPGRSIDIQRTTPTESPVQSVVTSDSGAYAGAPYPVTVTGDTFTARFSEAGEQVHGSVVAERSFMEWKPRAVTLTATADKTRALPGETVTVKGRLVAADDSTPLAGEKVRVSLGEQGSEYGGVVTTDADGGFTARLTGTPAIRLSGWSARPVDVFLSGRVSGPLAMPEESRIEGTTATLGADTTLTLRGTLHSVYDLSRGFGGEPVQLERSADGVTGWTKIASATAYDGGTFTLTARTLGGYYRARHLTTDVAVESVGAVVRLSRTQTRIISLNAAPEPVRKGAVVTVTGGLQQYVSGAWKPYGGQAVGLWFLPKGQTTWRLLGSSKSATNGLCTFRVPATVDGRYLIRYLGDSAHFNSTATPDDVDVI